MKAKIIILIFALLLSISTASAIDTSKVIAAWTFDDDDSTASLVYDMHENREHNLTVTGASRHQGGKIKEAFWCDGINDKFETASIQNDLLPAQGAIAFWSRINTSPTKQYIWGGIDGTHRFYYSDDNSGFRTVFGNIVVGDPTHTYSTQTFNFTVVNWNNSNSYVFVDNQLVNNQSSLGGFASTAFTLYLCSNQAGSGVYLNGSLDEMTVFNDSLTDTEISDLWNNGAGLSYPFTGAPTITLIDPGDNAIFNSDSLINLSLINVSADQDITDWTINDTQWSLFSSNATHAAFNNSDYASLVDGNYHLYITANNSNGLSSFTFNYTVDLITPLIDVNFSNGTIVTGNWTFQANLTDERDLNDYNMTWDGALFESNTISGAFYQANITVYEGNYTSTGRQNITLCVADSHNPLHGEKELIPFRVTKDLADNKISFDNVWIKSKKKVSDITYRRIAEENRYPFTIKTLAPTTELEMYVPQNCIYQPGSGYKGHFVCREDGKYIDFESDYDISVSGHTVTATASKPISEWEFSTVGQLNINCYDYYYYYFNTSQTFSSDVIEDTVQSFTLNFSGLPIGTNVTASFIYNLTQYTPTQSGYYFNANLTVPLMTVGDINETFATYWNYTVNAGAEINTSEGNQTVYMIYLDDWNCTVGNLYTLNISFLWENNDSAAVVDFEGNFDVFVPGYASFRNYSFIRTADNLSFCIYPDFAAYETTARIDYDTFTYNLFNFSLTNVTRSLNIYKSAGTTAVTFTVLDENEDEVEDVFIKVLLFDISTGTYNAVEVLRTDYLGVAIGNIILDTETYKFILEKDGVIVLETSNTIITSTSRTFRIVLEDDYFANYDIVRGIAYSLSFVDATNTFEFTYSDPTGGIGAGCLRVVRQSINGETLLSDSCTASTASTLTYTITEGTADNSYIGTGYIHFAEEFTLAQLWKNFNTSYQTFGESGLFMSFFLVGGLAMIGVFINAIVGIMLLAIGFLLTNLLGIFFLNWGYLVAFVILCGILVFQISRR